MTRQPKRFAKLSGERIVRSSKAGVFSIGPLAYYMHRAVPESGAHQAGALGGFEMNHDRIKRGQFYWGGGISFALGTLWGKTGTGRPSKSSVQDFDVQIRFGHTFWPKSQDTFYFTPFASFGYFRDINNAKPPTWVLIRNKFHFPYFGLGLIMNRFFVPWFSVGLKFQAYIMFDGKDEQRYVDFFGDPVKKRLDIDPKPQFALEVPFTYQIKNGERGPALQWAVFYNFRHYGERASTGGFLKENRFNIVGAKLHFTYRF